MNKDEIEAYIKAGKIAAQARELGRDLIKEGMSVLEICEEVEQYIIKLNAKPSFPCNISINEIAAHYSPGLDDDLKIPKGSVIKLDIGAHIDGYISDTAITVSLEHRFKGLVESTEIALNMAISSFKHGKKLGEIGKVIQDVIVKMGYKPIRNLGGHLISRYNLHAGIFVPNVFDRSPEVIQKDNVYAIEPFSTNGEGLVREGGKATIFSLKSKNNKGLTEEEKHLIEVIFTRFSYLPFSERWLSDVYETNKLREMLRTLTRKKILHEYPPLVENGKGMVAQSEHTVIVSDNQIIVTTLINKL